MPVKDSEGRTMYVTGFLFMRTRKDGRRWVALIHKNRPAWQAGLINGIGGKVEPTDLSMQAAMHREFEEESGMTVLPHEWREFALVVSPRSRVCFMLADGGYVDAYYDLPKLKDDTDEPCEWFCDEELETMTARVVPSLLFLLPLARQPEFNASVTVFNWTDPLPQSGG